MKQEIKYIQDYQVLRILGQGSQARVYLCCKETRLFAAKVFNRADEIQTFQKQCQFSQLLNNQHFPKIYQAIPLASIKYKSKLQIKRPVIIYAYFSKGDLFDYLQIGSRFTPSLCKNIFSKILDRFQYLINMGVGHRDIKPQNIMLDQKYEPIIIDFGHSVKIQRNDVNYKLDYKVGTNGFRPPQMQSDQYYGEKSQIFSLGAILFVLFTGHVPFSSTKHSNQTYRFMIRKNYPKFWSHQQKHMPKQFFPQPLKQLLNSMFSYNKQQRPTLQQLKSNKWLKEDIATQQQFIKQMNERYNKTITQFPHKKQILQLLATEKLN